MDDEQFMKKVVLAIAEADVVSIFFPLLRRALVVDLRYNIETGPMVRVMPQVMSMDERVEGIELLRAELGKIKSILAVPWLKSVRLLDEQGVTHTLAGRLVDAGLTRAEAERRLESATSQLVRIERMAFAGLIHGEGYRTLWQSKR